MANIVRSVTESTGNVLAIEKRGGLLEREALRLDDEEVAEYELKREPRAVDDIVLPSDVLEGDRVDVLVEDEGERDREVEDVEALRAQRVRQDLNRIRDDEGTERDSVPFPLAYSQEWEREQDRTVKGNVRLTNSKS